MATIRTLRKAIKRFAEAEAHDRLFTWFGVHVTKIHIYGIAVSGPVWEAFREGWAITGVGLVALAAIDLAGGGE